MRHRTRSLFRIMLTTAVLSAAAASARADTPEGFRGMKWGDPPSRLPNALAVSNPPGCYANRREDLHLATAPLFGVLYCFDDDRLVRVELRSATGEDNLSAFRDAVLAIFGQPRPQAPGSSRNQLAFTAPDAPVTVTLTREVLGVHKYLLVLEHSAANGPRDIEAIKEKQQDARKDFGF